MYHNITAADSVCRCDRWNNEDATGGVNVFTDGSVYNGAVGFGTCAAVLFPTTDDKDKIIQSRAVGKKVSCFCCEVEGIILGMQIIVDYFTILSSSSNQNITYILSDSCAAIDAVVRCKRSIRPETFRSLTDLRQVLYNMNIRVILVQIQGHSGILGNDIVDKEAKQIAFQMFKGNIVSPDEGLLSASEAYSISAEIARKSWQRHWDNEYTGRYTYNLIPVVRTKVTFSTVRDTGIAYCRMLLHKNSFRSDTSDTALCDCGMADESVEHFLFDCNIYSKARKVMMDTTEDLVLPVRRKRSLRITEHLLLAPRCDEDISKSKMLFVKEALFQFIASCGRII